MAAQWRRRHEGCLAAVRGRRRPPPRLQRDSESSLELPEDAREGLLVPCGSHRTTRRQLGCARKPCASVCLWRPFATAAPNGSNTL